MLCVAEPFFDHSVSDLFGNRLNFKAVISVFDPGQTQSNLFFPESCQNLPSILLNDDVLSEGLLD